MREEEILVKFKVTEKTSEGEEHRSIAVIHRGLGTHGLLQKANKQKLLSEQVIYILSPMAV